MLGATATRRRLRTAERSRTRSRLRAVRFRRSRVPGLLQSTAPSARGRTRRGRRGPRPRRCSRRGRRWARRSRPDPRRARYRVHVIEPLGAIAVTCFPGRRTWCRRRRSRALRTSPTDGDDPPESAVRGQRVTSPHWSSRRQLRRQGPPPGGWRTYWPLTWNRHLTAPGEALDTGLVSAGKAALVPGTRKMAVGHSESHGHEDQSVVFGTGHPPSIALGAASS